MANGGARFGSGPAPTIGGKAMQRGAADWRTIPQRDRSSEVPPWPNGGKEPTDPERAMWNRLWTTQAQAAIWEEQGLHDTVAQYVRTQRSFMDAYSRPSSNMGTLAKQLREELLLAPAALQRARIAIEGSKEAQALDSIRGTASAAYQPPPDHPRNRLRVVMPQPAAEDTTEAI